MSDYHTHMGLEHKFVRLGQTAQTEDGIAIEATPATLVRWTMAMMLS